MKKIYPGTGSIHWIVIIGALAAVLVLAGIITGSDGRFLMTGKLGYFFVLSL